MAKTTAVWGIDIGQCGVKALRCRAHEDPDKLVAEAFDYIEYPKILSQPEADAPALIREALQQFLSRNSVRGDRVAISVPGQNGLARFIKLPPVESKKIPDIVKYEARQQIPFPLEDVVWDYQQMAGGSEEDGFVLETEVGLFAMKRDQVNRALEPFHKAGIEIDIVQLTPLALYNLVAFDVLPKVPIDEYDPDNPPESVVVLSLGTETTDLVVTNGFRVWQRSIPLGGSHFTKALTKELKLTYAKAEHLKRHASQAENPKAIFQAMRPVFNDLVTEVQRSIGYFSNIDRKAKIGRIIALGSAMKLPGLQRFLQQNLGLEVERVEEYRRLTGAGVVDSPTFKEHLLAFGVCYGLAVQGLRDAKINTNLIPPEIVRERLIRAKKPWAIAAAAALMIGLTASFGGHWRAWNSVHKAEFEQYMAQASQVSNQSQTLTGEFDKAKEEYLKRWKIGEILVSNVEGRRVWLEVLKAINASLPQPDPKEAALPEWENLSTADGKKRPNDPYFTRRNEVHVTQIAAQRVPDLSLWYNMVKRWDDTRPRTPAPANPGSANPASLGTDPAAVPPAVPADGTAPVDPAAAADAAAAPADGPTGPGWVFQITGYHYHNDPRARGNNGAQYVRNTLLWHLREGKVQLPIPGTSQVEVVAITDLGIRYPLIVNPPKVREVLITEPVENALMLSANAAGQGIPGVPGGAPGGLGQIPGIAPGGPGVVPGGIPGGIPGIGAGMTGENAMGMNTRRVLRQDFVVQFCWVETPYTERRKQLEEKQDEQAAPELQPQVAATQTPGAR